MGLGLGLDEVLVRSTEKSTVNACTVLHTPFSLLNIDVYSFVLVLRCEPLGQANPGPGRGLCPLSAFGSSCVARNFGPLGRID